MRHATIRATAATGGLLLATMFAASPAGAYVDAGPATVSGLVVTAEVGSPVIDNCPLRRLGTTYVRCDNLTGNGASAPTFVPEWG